MFTCNLPASHKTRIPESVSIVASDQCNEASNNLKIIYNLPPYGEEKKEFAVCFKGFCTPEDQSREVIEWIEILKALGVDKFITYTHVDVHPNILKVAKFFSETECTIFGRSWTIIEERVLLK